MKNLPTIIVAILVIFTSTNLLAQAKIEGQWKPVYIDIPGQIYLHIEKDSIHLTDDFWEKADGASTMDSTAKATVAGAVKSGLMAGFTKINFLIDDKGDIYQTADNNKKIGQYDAAKNTLTFSDTDPQSKKVIPVEMKDGLLKFTLPGNKEEEIFIWCRKQ